MQRKPNVIAQLKRKPIPLACTMIAALCATMSAAHAGALPQGGQFVAGTGSIATSGSALTVTQNTARGVIDWNSFSIGNGNQVQFNNGSGATLNRVTGGNASSILGSLSATGSLYIINPQGVVIGSTGVVTTGGRFVASTLDIDNTAFMNGDALTLTGASNANVVNLGSIGSTHGDVFLIAAGQVRNAGSISAPQGTAELAAGRQILLQDSATGRQVFVQTGSKGTVLDSGVIAAAQVSLQAADGNVFALAGDHTTIRATGAATRDGHVWLVADSGTVALGGTIEARNADGSGGTVDTSGERLQIGSEGITPMIKAGQWNLTTPTFTIGGTAAAGLIRSLNAGTPVTLQTTGGSGSAGDIDVTSSLRWNGAASLALDAYRTINVDAGATLANRGSGNLALRADSTAVDNGGSVLNNGTLDWSKSTGLVSAYYDMNGRYAPGTTLSNTAWTSPTYTGLAAQITGYQLANSITDLDAIQNDSSGNYALGRDIGAGGTYIQPFSDVQPFSGQFDGLGHTIDGAGLYATGLFNVIGPTGAVRNLGLTNMNSGCTDCINGNLAAENDGSVYRVYSTGTVSFIQDPDSPTSRTSDLGGLVGINLGTIAQSWSSATVVGATDLYIAPGAGQLGGLVSSNYGTITQSYATGNISGGSASTIGGLVGTNYGSGVVTQSFATGLSKGGTTGGAGLIGSGGGGGSDDYWNVQTTGVAVGGGGVPLQNGLTTVQMSDPASFVGWNFGAGGVWAMPAGATHPILAWQRLGQ